MTRKAIGHLAEIIAHKRTEIEPLIEYTEEWKEGARKLALFRGFRKAVSAGSFGFIAERGAGSVCIDVLNVFRAHVRVPECKLHGVEGAVALGVRRGDVVRVRGAGGSPQLRIDRRPAPARMLQLLEHNQAAAFAQDKPPPKDSAAVEQLVVNIGRHLRRLRSSSVSDCVCRPLRIDAMLNRDIKRNPGGRGHGPD